MKKYILNDWSKTIKLIFKLFILKKLEKNIYKPYKNRINLKLKTRLKTR